MTVLAKEQTIFVVVSSNQETCMHRCLMLDTPEEGRWSTGETRTLGDWDDRNPLWERVA